MAINNRRFKSSFLAIVILLGLAPFVQAQNAGYFIVDTESGEHRFMQRLAWSGGEYALRYEVILEREVGGRYTAHLRDFTSSLFIEVSLPPGKYRFRVIPYDILDKPGEGSEWVNIEVHRAVQPEIFEASGRFVSSRNAGEPSGYVLTISGNNLDPGAEIFIRGSGGAQYISEEFVYDLGGNVMIFIDNGMLAPGEYEVIVKNPGGLEAGIGGVVLSRTTSSLIPDDAIIWQENGHGYLVVNQDMTWDEADTYARERGGHLVTITSRGEQKFIEELLSRYGDKNDYWLGGYREGRNWQWVTGESFRYTNWLWMRPDNSKRIDNKLQLVRIDRNYSIQAGGRQGQWANVSNDCNFGFIIEWDDAQVSQPNTHIPDDAIIWQENGHGYLVVNQDMTWDEADTYARERGGYLATITSSKEQRFVMDLLSRDGDKNNYWLGGYREGRNWHWVTGESFRYTNWLPTQPDNSHGIENKLQIVRILHSDAQQVRGRQGQWNDNSNDNFGWGSYGLIIEWDDAQVSQPNTHIPDDAIIWQENGHGYLVVDQSMTWDEANTYARERGGYLVTITSSNEQRFVMDLLSRDGDKNYYWLGGYREGTRWQWVTGESFRYTNYGNRQYSSNYFSIPTDKLSMYSIGGKWTRVIALGIHGFIIEWDAQTASAASEPEDRNAIQPLKSTLASINIAWMPVVPLHGNYFGSDFSPAGIMANANLAFYTPLDIYIGAELAAFLSVLHVDEGIYASSPLMLSAGFNLLAMKWLPSQKTAINFRIGAYSVLRDEYYEYGMVESNTAICFNIGPSLAFRLTNKFLLEIGVNYTGNQSGGGLRPWIGIGRLGSFGRRL
jgi:ribosome modulation factor